MNILVIGGIAAGMSVAAKAKRSGKDINITVIEREPYVSFGACGLPYYLGGQFDDENEMFARTPEQMTEAGINLLLETEVLSVDFDKKSVTIKDLKTNLTDNLSYDRLMIASGATPILTQADSILADNVYTITRLNEVNKLKSALSNYKKICIIGGGFIGIETADQLISQGIEVTLIEAYDNLLSQTFDSEISEKISAALSETGIKIHTGEKLENLIINDNLATKVITNKAEYDTDAIIVAIGFKPNTDFITDNRLEKLDNGAIVIDSYGKTSIPDVFSAGDCATVPHRILGTRYIPLATNANKLGRIVGNNIAVSEDKLIKFNGTLGSSCIKVGGYEAGSTGITEAQAISKGFSIKTVIVEAPNHSNYYPNRSKISIKLIYDESTKVILGAQVFGKDEAVLRLMSLTTAIHAGLTTSELGFIDFAYAPPFASTWEAINVAANAAK
jgi:Uncharacterized NAD(FAD)-dependent dehydrogenases